MAEYYRPYTAELLGQDSITPTEEIHHAFRSTKPTRTTILTNGPTFQTSPRAINVPQNFQANFPPDITVLNAGDPGETNDLSKFSDDVDVVKYMSQMKRKLNRLEIENKMLKGGDQQPNPQLPSKMNVTNDDVLRNQLAKYKDNVFKLNNKLIRKNKIEEKYIHLARAHQAQNDVIQKLQKELKKMKQKMDKMNNDDDDDNGELSNSHGRRRTQKLAPTLPPVQEVSSPRENQELIDKDKLIMELLNLNDGLRSELNEIKEQVLKMKNDVMDEKPKKSTKVNAMDDKERLEMYELMERMQGKVNYLQNKLIETEAREQARLHSLMDAIRTIDADIGITSKLNDAIVASRPHQNPFPPDYIPNMRNQYERRAHNANYD